MPESNQELQDIRFLIGQDSTAKHSDYDNISDNKAKKVVDLLLYGFNNREITSMLHITGHAITQIGLDNRIIRRRKYNYYLHKKGETDAYFPSLTSIGYYLGIWPQSSYRIKSGAKAQGYQLFKINYDWGDIPNNSFYMLDERAVYIKKGINSYGEVLADKKLKANREGQEWKTKRQKTLAKRQSATSCIYYGKNGKRCGTNWLLE